MDVLYIIICTLFINKRTSVFSPCSIFSFLVISFLWMCSEKSCCGIRHVWLRHEIYQHNYVIILIIKLNVVVVICTNDVFKVFCGWTYKLQVKLFYKVFFMFCFPSKMVSSRSQLSTFEKKHVRNFPIYFESYIENISPTFEKLQKHMFTKKPIYSSDIVRYALLLRYTSI